MQALISVLLRRAKRVVEAPVIGGTSITLAGLEVTLNGLPVTLT